MSFAARALLLMLVVTAGSISAQPAPSSNRPVVVA